MVSELLAEDTICAIATPHGVGGISVIRISGESGEKLIRKISGFLPLNLESHKAYFGVLKSSRNNENMDEVLVTYFAQGKSYTGETVFEISCHGNPIICKQILSELNFLGCRLAGRGEFTYRAFLNGKLDLVQAESVLAVIEGESEKANKLALRQLEGRLSEDLHFIESEVIWCLAHLEASIDFSTEGLEIVSEVALISRLRGIIEKLTILINGYNVGRIVKDGCRIGIVGCPNVGKSSILNLILEEDRAIVTDIAGTTRDLVDGELVYKGFKFKAVDTAGIRKNVVDAVENIGIERSKMVVKSSDIVCFVFDVCTEISLDEIDILDTVDFSKVLILGNKSDLLPANLDLSAFWLLERNQHFLKYLVSRNFDFEKRFIFLNSHMAKYRVEILEHILDEFGMSGALEDILVSSTRHFEGISRALEYSNKAMELLKQGTGVEFVSLELREGLLCITKLLGKYYDDQILDRIFKEFCIGK